MPAPPLNPFAQSTARRMQRLAVLLGDANGSTPTHLGEVAHLVPQVIVRNAGGQDLDYCEMEYHLGRTGEHLRNLKVPTGWLREVQVRLIDEVTAFPEHCLFWGDIVEQRLRLDARDETVTVQARLDNRIHFGGPLLSYAQRDPINSADVEIQEDPVFNPEIDGTIRGNRSELFHGTTGASLFVDPEAVATTTGQSTHGTAPQRWRLDHAVDWICRTLNPDEEFVSNPVVLDDALFTDAPPVENLRLRRGHHLPDYLDTLLHPLGFDWHVDVFTAGLDDVTRRIRIFKLGTGPEREVFWQDVGETRDPALTTLAQFEQTVNVADLANKIVAHGSFERREVTLPLYRGWPESEDVLRVDQLDSSKTAGESDYWEHPDAWRLFVANEAGDQRERRTTGPSALQIPSAPPDLSSVFTRYVPHRRTLEPCLTRHDDDRGRVPVFLEWSADAGTTWKEVPPEWGATLLTDMIGVRFEGHQPPAELWNARASGRLRITGTVVGDARLESTWEDLAASPTGRAVTLFLDVSDRYHDREIVTSGTYRSTIADNAYYTGDFTDEIDDRPRLATYVRQAGEQELPAAVTCWLTLSGLHVDYAIGDLITKVAGRNISLDRNSDQATAPRYLQVRGLRWNEIQQTTTLIVGAAQPPLME